MHSHVLRLKGEIVWRDSVKIAVLQNIIPKFLATFNQGRNMVAITGTF
jgi:hypothetical protein